MQIIPTKQLINHPHSAINYSKTLSILIMGSVFQACCHSGMHAYVKIGALNEHVQCLSITSVTSHIKMERRDSMELKVSLCMTRNEKQ